MNLLSERVVCTLVQQPSPKHKTIMWLGYTVNDEREPFFALTFGRN